MIFLTDEKIAKIIYKGTCLLNSRVVTVRELASFIGLIINAFYAILEAPIHYRTLERLKVSGLCQQRCFECKVIFNNDCLEELQWWIHNVSDKNGKRIRPNKIDYTFQTDASLEGFSCYDVKSNQYIKGLWSAIESKNQINYLELLAIFFGLKALYKDVSNSHI